MTNRIAPFALILALAACTQAAQEPASESQTDATPAPQAVQNESEPASSMSRQDAQAQLDRMAQEDVARDTQAGLHSNNLQTIPARFRGTWAQGRENCAARSFQRLTVKADRVSFFEDGGIASDVRGEGNALAITYPFENPDGVTERRVVYFALEDEDRMRVRRGSGDSTDYVRCPDEGGG